METYKIESEKTKEVVFTSTWQNAKEDWAAQLDLLKKGVHPKADLQKHFNKHGEKDFVFSSGKKVPEVKTEKPVEVKTEKPVVIEKTEKPKATRKKK